MNVGLVSLGCARTLVDSEVALGGLKRDGYRIVRDVKDADIAIVNTCGFIEEAKAESIEMILRLCEMKKKGRLSAVVVLGCLAQRHGGELRDELPEIDAIVGTDQFGNLAEVLKPLRDKKKVLEVRAKPRYLADETAPRVRLTPAHLAYVKISEGCINACSYCVIPMMKGAHRSRTVESVLEEVCALGREGKVSEVNLIGQDTAAFGHDRGRMFALPELLNALGKEASIPWLRLLYAHPGHVTEEMIEAIASNPTICKYVDFPVEHSHDAMLKRMNRGVTREKMEWGMRRLRERIPGVSIRTTIIVGFPGETREEFDDLLNFLREWRFERLGAFKFSREEGAKAYKMPDQIEDGLKQERYDRVMELQQEISEEIQRSQIGHTARVLVDEADAKEAGLYYGRTQADAPEVDGQVILRSPARKLSPGEFVDVRVIDAFEYDLVGEVIA